MATTTKKLITAEEFMAMPDPPDGSQQELVRGEVVTMPSPQGPHGIACNNVSFFIAAFVEANKLGRVASNDTGVVLERGPDTVRGPDVAYYSYQRVPVIPQGYFQVAPDLVAEVFSPSDSYTKLQKKVRHYLDRGVREVWVVDPGDRAVSIHRGTELPRVLDNGDTIDGSDVLPGFTCQVADLFD